MRLFVLLIAIFAIVIAATPADQSLAAGAANRAQPVVYQGYGFDACTAPSLSALSAWTVSPYRALGIYVGGVNRACGNGNLSASWVAGATGGGWSLLPLYVGLQAPCVGQAGLKKIAAALATVQGADAASDAVTRAAALGLQPGTPIYFDMEAYKTNDPLCSLVVEDFIAAWVTGLHASGYVAGVYGSAASTIRDVALLPPGETVDAVWIANWNGKQSVFGDPYVADSLWANHQRLHQYRGGHLETYGGVTINIDSSIVDAPVAGPGGIGPATPPSPPPPAAPAPTPIPAPTPAAGTASSPDGVATVDWPANAFGTAAAVTLTTTTLPKKTQGFAAGSSIAKLDARAATGAAIARFNTALVLRFGPLAPGLVPAYSPDGITWAPLARTKSISLPTGSDNRYSQATDGSITITTIVPGSFGLLLDTARPSRPTVTARLSRGGLQLRWQPATDNSNAIAGYQLTFGGKPILILAGTATHATITNFHTNRHQRLPRRGRRLRRQPKRRLESNRHHTKTPTHDPRQGRTEMGLAARRVAIQRQARHTTPYAGTRPSLVLDAGPAGSNSHTSSEAEPAKEKLRQHLGHLQIVAVDGSRRAVVLFARRAGRNRGARHQAYTSNGPTGVRSSMFLEHGRPDPG